MFRLIRRCNAGIHHPRAFSTTVSPIIGRIKEGVEGGVRYAPFLTICGSALAGIAYATYAVVSARKDVEKLREVFEEKIKMVEKTSEEKIKTVEKTSEEKIKTVEKTSEEKIKAAKAEAAKQAVDDFLKYNHSEEYVSLRKRTELTDSKKE